MNAHSVPHLVIGSAAVLLGLGALCPPAASAFPARADGAAAPVSTELGAATPLADSSTWSCRLNNEEVGTVTIWWGHTDGDAKWACEQWVSACGNAPGQCWAIRI